jgi:hypothetical protein
MVAELRGQEAAALRVLMGNSPQAYRDTLAAALGVLRPEIEVITVRPDELDAAVAMHAPDFVVCSELTQAIETCAPGWVLLYPDGAYTCVVTVRGERTTVTDMKLETILAGIDRLAG